VYTRALIGQGDRPEYMQSTTYDPAMIFVAALRKFGTNVTAAQVRDFIANLHDFPAATGVYDFRAYPQRGLGPEAVIVTRWDRSKGTWFAASKPGGAPL
jgi:ABC-type branched-subunit amino acid transport system substrate-binding protein